MKLGAYCGVLPTNSQAGDGDEDEDGEQKTGEIRASSLLLQVLYPLMRLGLVCSLMPPISSN